MYKKYREYAFKRSIWSLKAMNDLVSDKAGECEVIPPEEWNVTLRDGVNQDCSQMRSGGIAGEGRAVANEIGYFLSTLGGNDVIWGRTPLLQNSRSLGVGVQLQHLCGVRVLAFQQSHP